MQTKAKFQARNYLDAQVKLRQAYVVAIVLGGGPDIKEKPKRDNLKALKEEEIKPAAVAKTVDRRLSAAHTGVPDGWPARAVGRLPVAKGGKDGQRHQECPEAFHLAQIPAGGDKKNDDHEKS